MNRTEASDQLMSRVAWFALGALFLTTVHHVYGAYLYDTPWRLHVGFVSGFAAAAIIGSRLIARRVLTDLQGQQVAIPDPGHFVHLQFRRFAGCPVCNLHLQSFVREHDEITRAGIREVVVFHSTADELRRYTTQLPFDVIADPDKRLYRAFGVESSVRALLDPRAWPSIVRGLARGAAAIVRGRAPLPSVKPHGGRFGLPADFLIAPDGRVSARKYGRHASDQWSVDEVMTLARGATAAADSQSSQFASGDGAGRRSIQRDATGQSA